MDESLIMSYDVMHIVNMIPNTIIQILVALIGFSAILWQANRQHRSNIQLQIKAAQQEYKRKMYLEIEIVIQNFINAEVALSIFIRSWPSSFVVAQPTPSIGLSASTVNKKINELVELKNTLNNSLVGLLSAIERNEIIEPSIKIYQDFANVYWYDVQESFPPYYNEVLKYLPQAVIRDGKEIIISKPEPDREQMEIIVSKADLLIDSLDRLATLAIDFRIEIQNLLLGEIFERKLEYRKPLDPTYVVVTTNPQHRKKLETYIEESAWGKLRKKYNARNNM